MLRTVTAATDEPVDVEWVKFRLRIDTDALDDHLPSMITAAREIVERQTGFALVEASYEWSPEGDRTTPLPLWPGTVTSEEDVYPILFDTTPGPAPEPLKSAICLLVGDLLANTEANTEKLLSENPAVQNLMFPFRRVLP